MGGCSNKNDLICNYYESNDTNIEIKKMLTPDWIQCSLKYDINTKSYIVSDNNKIPVEAKTIFANIIKDQKIFNNNIPLFCSKQITHKEWLLIKSQTSDFNDCYIDCPDDTISKLYKAKGCDYIQISEKGLYYLEKDICDFGVDQFICPQKIRIRTKIHHTKNSLGYCSLSIMASCMPKNIKDLKNSKYSLDHIEKIPPNFVLIKN